MARKGGKNDFARPRARSKTRSNKPKLINSEDPLEEERLLKAQLSSAGLYAANTLGDGNCLFRALSDQLTGSDDGHASIRHEVCQHLSSHADRYRLFVDSDSVPGGYDGHVGSMRRLGTYGTNIELSAFANLYQRSIKVVQPGLTYVITPEPMEGVVSPDQQDEEQTEEEPLQENLTPRELRLKKRHAKLKAEKGKGKQTSQGPRATGTLYIVYHSWEHYSSIRRLAGPHSGLPNVEPPSLTPLDDDDTTSIPSTPDEPPPPLRRIRGRPKKPATTSTSLLAQSIALPPSGPPSPATSPPPPPSSDHLSIPHSSSPRQRARSASMSSVSGDDSHQSRKVRSRRQSPATSDAPSPTTTDDVEEHTDEEEEETETRETRSSKKAHPPPKPRRGPTAREKKDIARKRRTELRKARAGTSAAEKARSSRANGGEENVLMEVKELFI